MGKVMFIPSHYMQRHSVYSFLAHSTKLLYQLQPIFILPYYMYPKTRYFLDSVIILFAVYDSGIQPGISGNPGAREDMLGVRKI